MIQDEKWMQIAIEEAKLAMKENEVPVGAVLVQNNRLIAKAHNRPIKQNDPTAHAEIEVLRKAGKKLQNYRIPDTSLYVTLEPCIMCFGAIIHARVDKLIFGASEPKRGACGSSINLDSKKYFNHQIIISRGVLESECKNLLQNFFKLRR